VPYSLIIFGIFIAFALAEIAASRFFSQKHERSEDKYVELIGPPVLLALTQPTVLFLAASLAAWVAPGAEGMLAGTPFYIGFLLFVVFDDMAQYWWHRASHSFPFLYGLHRAHHNGDYMSIRIVYRNNILYYAFMPSLWLSGTLIYMGLGAVYGVFIVLKMTVVFGAHSNVRWDKKLYSIKALAPVMWVLERVISTPATHAAHHGKYASDPATNYKGNFGNMFFLWDILFGTAKITRSYPTRIGVEGLAPMSAKAQLLWPLLRDDTSPTEMIPAADAMEETARKVPA
jgi:sterol desaturase/sphingolipid hydroxylase (fatty acid hydroxylase superfamily)